jgi:hypothetical protein
MEELQINTGIDTYPTDANVSNIKGIFTRCEKNIKVFFHPTRCSCNPNLFTFTEPMSHPKNV